MASNTKCSVSSGVPESSPEQGLIFALFRAQLEDLRDTSMGAFGLNGGQSKLKLSGKGQGKLKLSGNRNERKPLPLRCRQPPGSSPAVCRAPGTPAPGRAAISVAAPAGRTALWRGRRPPGAARRRWGRARRARRAARRPRRRGARRGPGARPPTARGLHSSTFQLNLSRF